MDIDLSQFFQAFFEEAEELLAEAEQLLMNLDIDNPDQEQLNAIFRAIHSIKGGAATFGFNQMAEIAHVLETVLDRVRKHQMTVLKSHIDLFLKAKDLIETRLYAYRDEVEIDDADELSVKDQLKEIAEATSPATSQPAIKIVAPPPEIKTDIPPPQLAKSGHFIYQIELPGIAEGDVESLQSELEILGDVTVEKLENGQSVLKLETTEDESSVISICSFVVDIDLVKVTCLENADVSSAETKTTEEEGYGFFEPLEPAAIKSESIEPQVVTVPKSEPPPEKISKPSKSSSDKEMSSIRVDVEKVDQLINLVGELVIMQTMVEQQVNQLDATENLPLINSLAHLIRNTRELQEAVMSVRMMQVGVVFSRFPRMVRDLSSRLGKQIELITEGTDIELDRGIIERLTDPLTHLVRNSVDHGIEMPEVRVKSGKPPTGRLLIAASHRGGNVVIEISDDGAGLNRERIIDKAIKNGLNASVDMPDSEVWSLIFLPGFSTAEVVTEVSGRGVGMDVVRKNIAALGGTVEIQSRQGLGSRMLIALPLTLAIMDGLTVSLGEHVYVMPLSMIVEVLQPKFQFIKSVTGQGMMIDLRGDFLPIIPLHDVLKQSSRVIHPSHGVLLIVEVEGKRAALMVDGLKGQQQVVIKSLEKNFKRVPFFSGATIMGDGSVALILDAPAIVKSRKNKHYSQGIVQ